MKGGVVEFEEFFVARGHALLQLAYVLTEDSQLAEDLTQTALTNTYRRWGSVDHPYAYARRAIVNGSVDRWRRQRETPTPDSTLLSLAEAVDATTPASQFDPNGRLQELVRGLPPRQRAVLVLRYYEDLDDREIASMMNIAGSSVRSAAVRALAALRSGLGPQLSGRAEK